MQRNRVTDTVGDHEAMGDTDLCSTPPPSMPLSPCNAACPLRNLQSSFGITL